MYCIHVLLSTHCTGMLVFQGPKKVKEGEEFEILAKFASTMPIHLTECSWEVEAPKCGKPIKEDEM